jgi:hypothetical protein
MAVDWKKKGYRDFEDFAGEWQDFYSDLNEFYTKEFGKEFYSFEASELEIDPAVTDAELNLEHLSENEKAAEAKREWLKCASSFAYFAHRYIKISHPKRGLVPFRLYKYQRRVIDEFEKHQYTIVSKFRQGGLTTVATIWGLWRCMFRLDEQIMVLSKTDREAIVAGEVVARALEHLPDWLKPTLGKNTDHQKQFKETGSWINFYTPEAARGKSITYLIIDEAAFIADMERHWKAMYPTLATGGNCIVISTVNGIGNWYHTIYKGAENKKNEFHVIDLDYWEHPDYNNEEWVRKTKANLGDKGWRQEVLRDFLGSGDTYIPPEILARLLKEVEEIKIARKLFPNYANKDDWDDEWEDMDETFEKGALWVWKEPVDGHEYIIGVDTAEGVGEDGDNSCFQVIDVSTLEQVAEFYSNCTAPHIYAQILNEVGILYNTATIVIECHAPSGGAVLSNLEHKLFYENLYFDQTKKRSMTPGVKMNQAIRPVVLESLQQRILDNSLKINSLRLVNELYTFIYHAQKKRAEAQRGKHDDTIMAMAMALFVRDTLMRGIPIGADVPKELTQTLSSEVYSEIKAELQRGAPEDWLADEDEQELLTPTQEDILPGVVFNYKRKHDRLLKEFGWVLIPFIVTTYGILTNLVGGLLI